MAGEISFESEAYFLKSEDTYKLVWMDSLIYPELWETNKVQVSVTQAKRGEILGRNGRYCMRMKTDQCITVSGRYGVRVLPLSRLLRQAV